MSQASDSFRKYEPKNRFDSLIHTCNTIPLDIQKPIKLYFRTGQQMIKMADFYMSSGEYEKAFIFYTKYVVLMLETLRNHPNYENADPADKNAATKKCTEILTIAENIKGILIKKYQEEYDAILEKQQIKEEAEKKAEEEKKKLATFENTRIISEKLNQMKSHLKQESKSVQQERSLSPNLGHNNTPSAPDLHTLNSSSFEASSSIPSVDRSTKPPHLVNKKSNNSLDKLNCVIIPKSLMKQFLHLAEPNTSNNIETCGILSGRLRTGKFVITHVLIPIQKGSSESCQADDMERVFAFQDRNDLITLGWIHTHPSQSCFMSSIDLHTHCYYQLLFPEAIAIVCSPKYDQIGIYSLTIEYGLPYIAKCEQTGFHPHPTSPPIYEDCKHTIIDENEPVEIIDLRI